MVTNYCPAQRWRLTATADISLDIFPASWEMGLPSKFSFELLGKYEEIVFAPSEDLDHPGHLLNLICSV